MKKLYIFLLISTYLWAGREALDYDYFKQPEPKKENHSWQEQKEIEKIAEQKLIYFEIAILQIRTHFGYEFSNGLICETPEEDYEKITKQKFLELRQRFDTLLGKFKNEKKYLTEVFRQLPSKRKRLRTLEGQIYRDKYHYDNKLEFTE